MPAALLDDDDVVDVADLTSGAGELVRRVLACSRALLSTDTERKVLVVPSLEEGTC